MRILCITPVKHIPGVCEILESIGEVTYWDDPRPCHKMLYDYDAVFTNPNKSKIYLDASTWGSPLTRLKVIATASTGTDHIDQEAACRFSIKVLSLAKEYDTINRISSTAEHAFALMMCGLRHIPAAAQSVKCGEWNYEPFIGRQLDHLEVGIIGYGRLGGKFARYCRAFGVGCIRVYDGPGDSIEYSTDLLTKSDVISLHVHLTDETRHMVNEEFLGQVKDDVVIVNTSRGDIVDEEAMVQFLHAHPKAFYATDVTSDEAGGTSLLIRGWPLPPNLLITPHIGGMTREGQQIAYTRMAEMLKEELCAISSQRQG